MKNHVNSSFSNIITGRTLVYMLMSAFLCACATSPTGRQQLMMVDDASIAPMAAESFEAMKEKEKVVTDSKIIQYVKCVVNPLTREASPRYKHLPDKWEVVVFDSKQANAFAMPGGKIGIYTGLMTLTENPDQLAAVVGHEIAHVISRHAAERMSTAQMTVIGLTAAGVALSGNENQQIIMGALGLGASIGIQLPFSRVHESEADEIGQELMSLAGFDPRQAISLWRLMATNRESQSPEFLSTHPDPSNRAMRLERLLGKMQPIYNQARASGKQPQCQQPATI
jgi:predicted Zn-dependent protease